jgi:hypothetical protein
MTGSEGREEDEDPKVGRMLRRMRLVMVVSMVVLLAGMAAVVSVIIYRIAAQPATPAPNEAVSVPALPAGSRILGTTADGRRLYVTVATPDGAEAILEFDAATRAFRGRIPLVPAHPD